MQYVAVVSLLVLLFAPLGWIAFLRNWIGYAFVGLFAALAVIDTIRDARSRKVKEDAGRDTPPVGDRSGQ
jgi:hypothetical protein